MKRQLLCLVLTVAMIFTMISHTVVATGEENPSDPMVVDSSATSESETSAETSSTAETEAPAETSSSNESRTPEETTGESNAVDTVYVAESNGVKYTSIQAAIDEAPDVIPDLTMSAVATTITLLTDVTLVGESIVIPPTKMIILDLNDHILTGIPTAESIRKENGYKVIEVAQQFKDASKNETDYVLLGRIKIFIYAELTIQNGTIVCDCTESELTQGTIDYAIDTIRNHGDLTIIDATIENKALPGQLGFAVDNHSGFADTYVTIKSSAIISSGSDYCESIRQYDVQINYHNNIDISEDSVVSSICVQKETDEDVPLKNAVAKATYKDTDGQYYTEYCKNVYDALGYTYEPGDKVVVLQDSEEVRTLTHFPGVILDLNGKRVTIKRSFDSEGEIVDSADGEGLLIAKTFEFYSAPALSMPLYDKEAGGYRFFNYSIQFAYDKKQFPGFWYFLAKIDFTNVKGYELLATGESRMTFACDVSWQASDSAERSQPIYWTIEPEVLIESAQNAIDQMNAGQNVVAAMGVLISGLEAINGGNLYMNLYVVDETVVTGFKKSSGERKFPVSVNVTAEVN